jgi:hypothetical protein
LNQRAATFPQRNLNQNVTADSQILSLLILPLALAGPIYKDPTRPISERVADLLSQMKLEEKVGQLALINGQDNLTREWKRQQAGAVIQI